MLVLCNLIPKNMANKSLTEPQLLKDLARIQLFEFDPSEDERYVEEEKMEKECDKPWSVPTREARDLILAEEIMRFASITDRPCTSQTHRITRIIQNVPDSTSDTLTPDSEPFPCNRLAKATSQKTASEPPESVVADKDGTATETSATSKAMYIASEAGTSAPEPPQSACFGSSQPLASSFQDAYFPEGEANIPIDPQPKTRPNAIPVTNRILAVIAQSKLERSSSSAPVILDPVGFIETKAQLFKYLIENAFQDFFLSRSSSPESLGPASLSPSKRSDELSALNLNLSLTTELEEIITKHMKVIVSSMLKHKFELQLLKKELNNKLALLPREWVETGEGNKYYPQANQKEEPKGAKDEIKTNQQEAIPAGHANTVDNTCNQPANPYDNSCQHFVGNHLNVNNVEAFRTTDDNDAVQSEFPEEDDSSGLEWTRPEKRRLGTVIRDLSREMKTKKLQQKKARLLKKGRVIAQAIENKICDINKEITTVNKKSLRHVALPLDEIQEYDWFRVATVLNAKRSPEECRTYWKCFLHPTINGCEWSLVEVKAMEMIAHRYNFRNWDDIAKELNTGRSGYQCYTFYRKHLCPHSELRDTCNQK